MSRRDKRFKPLKWELNLTNTAWKAEALGRVYYITRVDAAFMENAGYLVIKGVEFSTVYAMLSDAQTVCQLEHEARIKEWMNV
jgi:hypothetical protein